MSETIVFEGQYGGIDTIPATTWRGIEVSERHVIKFAVNEDDYARLIEMGRSGEFGLKVKVSLEALTPYPIDWIGSTDE